MTQEIMQAVIETAKAAIMALREADNQVNNARTIHTNSRSEIQALRQSTFCWKVDNEYHEMCNFEMEVKNIFMTNDYNTQ